MADRDFFDANILIYAYDRRDPVKQARAFDLLSEDLNAGQTYNGVVVVNPF